MIKVFKIIYKVCHSHNPKVISLNILKKEKMYILGKLSSSTIVADNVDKDTKGLRFFSNSCTIY